MGSAPTKTRWSFINPRRIFTASDENMPYAAWANTQKKAAEKRRAMYVNIHNKQDGSTGRSKKISTENVCMSCIDGRRNEAMRSEAWRESSA